MDHIADRIEALGGPSTENIQTVVRETLAAHKRILFSGDNYSEDWKQEAARRGLLDRTNTPAALSDFASPENISLFEQYGVFSAADV